jgi:hypothetical protein
LPPGDRRCNGLAIAALIVLCTLRWKVGGL